MEKNIKEKNKEMPRVIVGAFIFNDKDELFLMKGVHYQNKYICPGGHVELGETLIDVLKREIKEETNIDLIDIEFVSIGETVKLKRQEGKQDSHHIYVNYKARAKTDKKIKLNDEAREYKWLTIDDWKKEKKVKTSVREFIENFKNDSFEAMYKRALADYQNLLKQSIKEKQDFVKYANEQLLHQLIPVYNNLKISLQHTDENIEKSAWGQGVKYVLKQFTDILSNNGVKEIKTVGEKFDHNTMDAVKGRGDVVSKEISPGYELNGKVIIPAKVELEK